jgi:toxin ParE1/3/4
MVRVWRSRRANDDLLNIWLYVAKDSVAAADRLIDTIDEKCRLLIDHPEIGPARPEIGPEIRSLSVKGYLVLYRIADRRVEIIRIVHGARRIESLLR